MDLELISGIQSIHCREAVILGRLVIVHGGVGRLTFEHVNYSLVYLTRYIVAEKIDEGVGQILLEVLQRVAIDVRSFVIGGQYWPTTSTITRGVQLIKTTVRIIERIKVIWVKFAST